MNSRYVLLSVAVAVLLVFPAAIGLSQDRSAGSHFCSAKETVPLDIVLSVPGGRVIPGATTSIHATITAEADMNDIELRIRSEGNVTLMGVTNQYVGSLSAGEKMELDVPALFADADHSAVLVSASARHAKTGESMGLEEGVYTIVRNGRPYTGRDGFVALEHSSIREDLASGLLTQEAYDAEMKASLAADGTFDQTPGLTASAVSGVLGVPKLEPAMSEGQVPLQNSPQNPLGTITVEGTVLFTDENGTTHGAYGIQVEVWDDDTIIDEFITSTVVGDDGEYSFIVDNDDGFLQDGRDIYVKFLTKNEAIDVQDGGTYENNSPVHDSLSDGAVVTENFTYANAGDGPAASICVGASYVAGYVKFELNGGSALSQIGVNWPAGGAFYDGSSINYRAGDRWDWDVVDHEYGHYVMDHFNFEANPGGPHSSGNCNADVRPSKDEGIKLAWGEGWPTYFGITAQIEWNLSSIGMPRVGDTNYQDTEESSIAYSLENNPEPLGGDDNERTVMRVFFDLNDSAVDGNDAVDFDHKALFDVLDAAGSETFSQAWAALRASSLDPDNQTDLAIGAMCSDYGIGPVPSSPSAGTTVSPSNTLFNWSAAVGCGTVAGGNQWDVVFYNPVSFAQILTVPNLATTSTNLSLANLQALIAGGSNHQVLWAVEGKNTSSPATGPYLGDNFSILVNQPPVANAGPDVVAECTGPTGTPVNLSGLGSSDPDGDALTYSWSPAGLFNDSNSPTPTGTFPRGVTVVTLTVSDGLDDDTDQVQVTIVDTTPPEVTCPADITVECSAFCGTPADDPQLTAFFATFAATDVCCPSDLETDLDNPDCFPVGETTVTFTATDCADNVASCTAKVTVVDTTPPEIDVVLNRDVLWPPNHKFGDITAEVTVTDICCENPTFVLLSITSDEPEDGKGDGNTSPDIQDADYGTPDTAFQLRSERLGNEDGRVYTITYRATDCVGNTADNVVYVRVPHDHAGWALASMGFQAGGLGFEPTLDRFVLIIPSKPAQFTADASGNQVLSSPAFDATSLDVTKTYVGNLKGVVLPNESLQIDNDADGLTDLALYYPAQDVNEIMAASMPTDDGAIKVEDSWGAIGLHYASGTDYLVTNIFMLGDPVPLVPPIVIGRTDDAGDSGDETKDPEPDLFETPNVTALLDIHPNPFNPTTTIPFHLMGQERVSLRVYDAQGKLVRTLLDEVLPEGLHEVVWDGRDNSGSQTATGVYFVRFVTGANSMTKKVVMIK